MFAAPLTLSFSRLHAPRCWPTSSHDHRSGPSRRCACDSRTVWLVAHRRRCRLSSTSSVYVFILYLLVTAADDFDASRDVQVIGSHFPTALCSATWAIVVDFLPLNCTVLYGVDRN